MEMGVGRENNLSEKDNFKRENDKIMPLVVDTKHPICWLVDCLGFKSPLRQYLSISGRLL